MIHRYINNGYHIVMDVNSGSVHVMDRSAYDAVPVVERLIAQGTQDQEIIAQALEKELSLSHSEAGELAEEFLALKEAGQLFTQDIYEDYIDAFTERETVVKASACTLPTTVIWPVNTALQGRANTTADGR